MKRNLAKILSVIICTAVFLSLAGCAKTGNSKNQADANENAVYAKVTAINGTEITVALGTMNAGQRQNGAGSDNGAAGDTKGAGQNAPANSGTAAGQNAPTNDSGAGGAPAGGRGPQMITLTGETKIIDITDQSIIKKRTFAAPSESGAAPADAQEDASLSDLAVDGIVKIEYADNGNTISAIIIMGGTRGGQIPTGAEPSGPSDSGQPSNAAAPAQAIN